MHLGLIVENLKYVFIVGCIFVNVEFVCIVNVGEIGFLD